MVTTLFPSLHMRGRYKTVKGDIENLIGLDHSFRVLDYMIKALSLGGESCVFLRFMRE